jgi:hypothetical protein
MEKVRKSNYHKENTVRRKGTSDYDEDGINPVVAI